MAELGQKNLPKGEIKYVGLGNNKEPTVGSLQAQVLRMLWEGQTFMTAKDVFYRLFLDRRKRKLEPYQRVSIERALSQMVDKGLIASDKDFSEECDYAPRPLYIAVKPQEIFTCAILNDACHHLTGMPLEELLQGYLPEGMTIAEIVKIEMEKQRNVQSSGDEHEPIPASVDGPIGE